MRAGSCFFLSLLMALGCAARPAAPPRLPYPGLASPAVSALGGRPSAVPSPNAAPRPTSAAPPTSARASELPPRSDFGEGPFAGEGPLLLERAASDGQWLTICQARQDSDGDGKRSVSFGPGGEARGDALQRFLITPGAELANDGVLDASANGRYAIVLQQSALVLWDNQSGRALDLSQLGVDARLSAESFRELRSVAFDASSERLLYLRAGTTGPRVVVRDLRDGSEQGYDPGPGPIWRAQLAPSGSFAILEMMTSDSNGNGRADFPSPFLAAPRACAASPGRFHTFVDRGDRPETVLLPLNGAPAIHEPDLVMPVGDTLLLRDATGALLLQRVGKKRVLEPAPCKGRIVHADAQRELFVVGCVQKKKTGRVSLELVTPTEHKPLGIELASLEVDRELSDSPRLVAFYPGSDTVLLDADHRDLRTLQAGDTVIATRAGRALVRRGKALLIYDADTRAELALPVSLDKFPELLVTQPFAFVSPALVNLETGQLVGISQARPLALSSQGRLLVNDGEMASSGLVNGPLRWVLPSL